MPPSAGRRSTLATVENSNPGSSIPVPTSAIKSQRTLNSSQSGANQYQGQLPPASHRQSAAYGGPAASGSRPNFSGRQSVAHPSSQNHHSQYDEYAMGGPISNQNLATPGFGSSQGGNARRQSVAGNAFQRDNNIARQSVAGTPNLRKSMGGRQSLAPGASTLGGGSQMKIQDPRPKDKSFRASMSDRLLQVLQNEGFTMNGFTNRLTYEPTQNQFILMFKFIYNRFMDEEYQFGQDGKKFEEEVITLLKEWKYPTVDDISKTKLSSAGSGQAWPTVLLIFDWMINLGEASQEISIGPLEREANNESQGLLFPHLWRTYDKFWKNQDEYPEEMAYLEDRFTQENRRFQQDIDQLESDRLKYNEELAQFTEDDSPLVREQKRNHILVGDTKKFNVYRESTLDPKLEKTRKQIEHLTIKIAETEAEIVKQQAKADALQKQVNAQEISPDEFERMSTERDTLERQRLEVEALIAEEKSKGWNLELSLNQKQDALERDVKSFNLLGAEVGLFPMTINPDGIETELLELEIVHSNIETMLPKGVDMKKLIKPTILELKRKAVEEYQEISDRKEKDQAEFDELADQSAILTSENADMEKRKDDITAVANHNHQVLEAESTNATREQSRLHDLISKTDEESYAAVEHWSGRASAYEERLRQVQKTFEIYEQSYYNQTTEAIGLLVKVKGRCEENLRDLVKHAERYCEDE